MFRAIREYFNIQNAGLALTFLGTAIAVISASIKSTAPSKKEADKAAVLSFGFLLAGLSTLCADRAIYAGKKSYELAAIGSRSTVFGYAFRGLGLGLLAMLGYAGAIYSASQVNNPDDFFSLSFKDHALILKFFGVLSATSGAIALLGYAFSYVGSRQDRVVATTSERSSDLIARYGIL